MASPVVLTLAALILLFFVANAILFMIARMREANRDQQDKQADEGLSDEEIEGLFGSES